jgi:hypothetical protein
VAFEAVEKATDPDQTNYDKIKAGFTQLKADSYEIEKFLQQSGHTPEYLAAVGGPYAVPNYVYDIHVDYYWPTKNPQKTQYPSSLAAYATLKEDIDPKKYTKEDLAAGRLAAGNLFDLTRQLARTFFYREFLPNGEFYDKTPTNWQTKACFADGHRINQPELDSLSWDPNVPYYPYEGVNPELESAGFNVDYYLPRNESNPYDANMTIWSIMDETVNYGYFHFMPHGGLTNLRIEVGIKPNTTDPAERFQNDFLEASEIAELNYKAPTLIYTTCCKGGVWMLDEKQPGTKYKPSDFITSSFIHAGAVAYIATPEIQTGCFWKDAPYAVSGEQSIQFWKNVFSGNVPIGEAWRDAKWTAHQTYEAKTPKPDSSLTHHVDCISYTLFGDPALEIFKPKVDFKTIKEIDMKISIAKAVTGENFTVNIIVTDLLSGDPISDAQIKVKFQGTELEGDKTHFDAPENEGAYDLEIEVTKSGYQTLNAKTWVDVVKTDVDNGDSDDKDEGKGFLPGFDAWMILTAVSIVIIFFTKYRKFKF